MATILVVDDEMGIRELLSEILEDEGHEIVLAENAVAARRAQAQQGVRPIDLVLLDIWMPDTDGLTLLKEWVAADTLRCPVIMMSGHASIDTAVEATGLGAMDFLEKPIAMHRLLASVHKALSRSKQHSKFAVLPASPQIVNDYVTSEALPADIQNTEIIPLIDEACDAKEPLPADPALQTQATAQKQYDVWQQALAALDLNQPLRDVRDQFEMLYFNHLPKSNGQLAVLPSCVD
jgi:DNA-binding response OmpR family regulator